MDESFQPAALPVNPKNQPPVRWTPADAPAVVESVLKSFGPRVHGIDHLDGVTVDLGDGSWFNLRMSNTEPLLRLNVEALTAEGVSGLVDEIGGYIRAGTRELT